MECKERRLVWSNVGPVKISTVFLGLDHGWRGDAAPVLFETMIFHDLPKAECDFDRDWWRYSTLAEARSGHAEVVAMVQKQFPNTKSSETKFPTGEWLPGGEAKAREIKAKWQHLPGEL